MLKLIELSTMVCACDSFIGCLLRLYKNLNSVFLRWIHTPSQDLLINPLAGLSFRIPAVVGAPLFPNCPVHQSAIITMTMRTMAAVKAIPDRKASTNIRRFSRREMRLFTNISPLQFARTSNKIYQHPSA